MNSLSGIQPALCSGFAGVNATVNSVGNSITQQMYTNQLADMQQSFALQSQFAQCCCDNRTQGLQNTQAIIDSQSRGIQAILDKLCQLELDNVKQDNANLRTQLNMANLAASQAAQTAEIRQSQATTANQLVSELRSCPIPAQPVYGSQPIFTCSGGSSAGCGCGNAF